MKWFLVISLLIISAVKLHSQSNIWLKQNISYRENFSKIFFSDSLHGWIAGDSALILHTSNGGNSWSQQFRNPQLYIRDMFFLNNNSGWVIAWKQNPYSVSSYIIKTTNGGASWLQEIYPDTLSLLNTIYFLNSNTGFLGLNYTSSKIIFKTTNSGINWIPVSTDSNFVSSFPVNTIKFLNDNTGYAAGGYFDMAGVIWKTTNGGNYWASQSSGAEPLNSITFPSLNKIIISGGDYEFGVSLSASSDAGNTFKYSQLETFGIGYQTAKRTDTEIWIACGFSHLFLKSIDTGNTFQTILLPDTIAAYSICFPNSRTGWACGSNGTLLKYTAEPVSVNNTSEITPTEFANLICYPNPFNSSTVIHFNHPKQEKYSLIVFNILGQKIFDKKFIAKSGNNSITLNLTEYPSGIYFVKIISDNHSQKEIKIIHLK